MVLKREIADLDRQEQELDRHKLWVQQSIKNVTDEVTNTEYPLFNILTLNGLFHSLYWVNLKWSLGVKGLTSSSDL